MSDPHDAEPRIIQRVEEYFDSGRPRWRMTVGDREKRRDVVITCSHGQQDTEGDYVVRYRWNHAQGSWVPTDHAATDSPMFYADNTPWNARTPGAGKMRVKAETRCHRCPNNVPTHDEKLQLIFSRLDRSTPANEETLRISLDGLRSVLSRLSTGDV